MKKSQAVGGALASNAGFVRLGLAFAVEVALWAVVAPV